MTKMAWSQGGHIKRRLLYIETAVYLNDLEEKKYLFTEIFLGATAISTKVMQYVRYMLSLACFYAV